MRDSLKFYRLSNVTFYDHINTIYQFIKPFFDKKCLFLRTMEPLSKMDAMPIYGKNTSKSFSPEPRKL